MSQLLCALAFILFSLFPPKLYAADFYVGPDACDPQFSNQCTGPLGSDNNPGTLTQPFKTFTKSWSVMKPGDTLILLDGVFYQAYLPTVGGTETTPLTTKALHDGQAIIDGQYTRPAIQLGTWNGDKNGHYHLVEGIIARNSSQTTIDMLGNYNTLRRVSAYNAFTDGNVHNITSSTGAVGNTVEDCIAAGSGRKMVFAYSGSHMTVRRCVGYWQEWDGRNQVGTEWPWSNGFEMYNSSDSIIENAIALGAYNDPGLNVLSNMSTTQSPNPANNNKVLGSMVVNNGVYPDGTIWRWGRTRPQPHDGYLMRRWWEWGHKDSVGVNTWGHDAVIQNTLLQDIFSYGSMGTGLGSTWEFSESVPQSTVANRVTVINNNRDSGISPTVFVPVGTDILTNKLSHFTITNSRIGQGYDTSTRQIIPNPYTGEGARLAHRYINGVLKDGSDGTPAQALWPWSMQDRLIKETGIDITGYITTILNQQNTNSGNPLTAPVISPEPPWGSPLLNLTGVTYLSGVTVTLTKNASGTVYYTLDGTDPQTSSTKKAYTNPFSLSQTTLVKAREQVGSSWSHLRAAYYLINPGQSNQAPLLTADAEPFIYPYVEIVLPTNKVELYATVEDFTYPSYTTVITTQWAKVSGPGTVTFGNLAMPRTSATFSQAGLYTLRLTASDGQLTTTKDVQVRVWPPDLQGVVHSLPGRIEAENYKSGGEGIGYHQTRWYGDGLYRNLSPYHQVDITYAYNDFTTYAVNHINGDEWYAYDVDIANPGVYQGTLRYSASPGGNTLRVLLDNQDISGTLTTQPTLNAKKYGSLTFTTSNLPQGRHELRILIDPLPTPTPDPNPTIIPGATPTPTPRPPFLPNTTINYLEFTTGTAPPPNPADLNGDSFIDFIDFQALIGVFNTIPSFNLIGTGLIDIFDFNYLLNQY